MHSLRAAGRGVAPPIANIERNLVLAYHPGWQSLEDLNAIARHVSDIDSTIRTFIVPTTHRNPVTRKHAAQRPALIVSPGQMRVFRPLRGNVYQGGSIAKVEQVRPLEKAGVPVPRTEILTPDLRLDPQTWGEFVILKPTDIATSSRGLGIQLMRTNRVRYIPPDQYPSRHPGRYGPMIVQQFVDTGEYFMAHRVLTFFGEPLYMQINRVHDKRVDLRATDAEIEAAPIATQAVDDSKQDRVLSAEPEVIALARAAHAALPGLPLKGTDVLREASSGKLYVIEMNCGGNTWHFSSRHLAELRAMLGPEYEPAASPVRRLAHRRPGPRRKDYCRGCVKAANAGLLPGISQGRASRSLRRPTSGSTHVLPRRSPGGGRTRPCRRRHGKRPPSPGKGRAPVFLWRIVQDGKGGLVGVWQTRTGVLVNRGILLDAGTPQPIAIPFEYCGQGGCEATGNLASDFLESLGKAQKASATIFGRNGKGLTFQLSVKGLGDGLAELKK
ncbi:MAG TPA: invasion associated locus B family protein [Bauldia sp.]